MRDTCGVLGRSGAVASEDSITLNSRFNAMTLRRWGVGTGEWKLSFYVTLKTKNHY